MKNSPKFILNENKLLHICADIEYHGIKLDIEYVKRGYELGQQKIKQAKKDFEKDTGRPYKDSPKLFAEVFTERGEKFPKTEKGNPSFRSEVLVHMDSPTARLINNIRSAEKITNTYFKNFLKFKDRNGYIHPSMNQAGTKTGRFSYSHPNLQNLPKESSDDSALDVRRCFVVPDDSYFIYSFDFDQMEYKLLVDYLGVPGLVRLLNSGSDFHQVTADRTGVSRRQAKTLNFAMLYGVGFDELANMLGTSKRNALELKTKVYKEMPKLWDFIYEVRQKAKRRGYTFNRYNRIYKCRDGRFSYKHVNYIIQGSCADFVKEKMVDVHDYLKTSKAKSRMILQVHDQLDFYIHKKETYLIDIIKEIMEQYESISGIKMSVGVSKSERSLSTWDLHEGA